MGDLRHIEAPALAVFIDTALEQLAQTNPHEAERQRNINSELISQLNRGELKDTEMVYDVLRHIASLIARVVTK